MFWTSSPHPVTSRGHKISWGRNFPIWDRFAGQAKPSNWVQANKTAWQLGPFWALKKTRNLPKLRFSSYALTKLQQLRKRKVPVRTLLWLEPKPTLSMIPGCISCYQQECFGEHVKWSTILRSVEQRRFSKHVLCLVLFLLKNLI